MARTAIVAARVSPGIKAATQRAAADDHRSLASFLEHLLISHLVDHGYLQRSQTAPSERAGARGHPFNDDGHLMSAMMAHLNLDVQGILQQQMQSVLQRAQQKCVLCRDSEACRDWLEDGGEESAYRNFCPNAPLFDYMAEC